MTSSTDTQTYSVPFADGSLSFALPPGISGSVANSSSLPPLSDPISAAYAAMESPVKSPSLRELAAGKRNACIAITDATRACPDHLLVPPMLAELEAGGMPPEAVTFLVAVGTHRPSTRQERIAKLGAEIASRYTIIDHDAADDANLVPVMDGPGGIPFRLNRTALEADLLLSTGVVEPHQYAGFSGGGKTVAIGCADEATISCTHGPAMLDQPGTRLAQLSGNPFQHAVREVAKRSGLAFAGNAVLDDEGRPVAFSYGAPEAVQDHLSTIASPMFTVPIPAQFDIAVAGVGAPKGANLYQASRAATYLQFAPTPVVRRGGVVILPARCPEGAGDGAGEQRFLAAMRHADGASAIVERLRREGVRPGEQRAYIVALMLEHVRVAIVGAQHPELARSIGFDPCSTMDEALDWAAGYVGTPANCLVVPHALQTLPVVTAA
jgi:nickel-dependent lactate racemase